MPETARRPDNSGSGYQIEPRNKIFEAFCAIPESEFFPGHTVSFLSEVDLTAIEQVRADAPKGAKPSYTAFVVKAVALALKDHPYANRRVCRRVWPPLLGVRLQRFLRRDIAVAIERDFPGTEAAAFLDVIRDADRLPLTALTEKLRQLSTADVATNQQWREFSTIIARLPHRLAMRLIRLPLSFPGLWVKYRGGAVLVSSPAKYGVDAVLGTWSHPLGISFGLVKPRPVVVGSEIVARPTFALTMNFDRRVMAGAQAARFFKRIVDALTHAETNADADSDPNPRPSDSASYTIEPRNPYFEATRSIVEHEIHPEYSHSFVRLVDLTEVEELRSRSPKEQRPSYTAIVAKAVALALQEVPESNRRVCRRLWPPLLGRRTQRFHQTDLAVAVERDLPGSESAVFMDILRDADRLSLAAMTDQLQALAVCDMTNNTQWREFSTIITRFPRALAALLFRLPLAFPSLWVKYRGGAVMISSPAKYGVDIVAGSWTHPLGISFGLVKPRPVVVGSEIVARPTFFLTFNVDRRVMSRASAAHFFRRVVDLLEHAGTTLDRP